MAGALRRFLVDPSNPFSFLAFLSAQKRLCQFINANFQSVSRAEFALYYRWVCTQLTENLMFNNCVHDISLSNNQLLIKTDNNYIETQSVILGHGLSPYLPACAKQHNHPTLFHSSVFMHYPKHYQNKKIVIIGGVGHTLFITFQITTSYNIILMICYYSKNSDNDIHS